MTEASATTLERFRLMALMRAFEEACLEGVEAREIHGELHVGIGQEAIAAGMAESLRPHDAVVSTHRNHLHAIAKGVPLRPMLAEVFERETGLCRGRGGHMHLFDPDRNFSCTGIVGSSLGVALGFAYAAWIAEHDGVGVGVTGDGGANTGAFHECLNIAGAWKLPYVVLVENNEYAISVPITGNLATPTIAERAAAYSAWGRRVDGTDPDAVAAAFAEAVEYARGGRGPAVLEATCYRFRGHYEGDFDLYRPKDEKEAALRDRDPLILTGRRLVERGEVSQPELDSIVEDARRELAGLLAEIRADPAPDPRGARDYVFVQ